MLALSQPSWELGVIKFLKPELQLSNIKILKLLFKENKPRLLYRNWSIVV